MPRYPWSNLSLSNQFDYQQELSLALCELRVSPAQPPTRGSLGYEVAKLEYVMEKGKSKMAGMVSEIIDLPVVKEAIMKMVRDEDPDVVEKALKMIPAMISAMVKAANPRLAADDGKDLELDTSDLA